MWRALVWPGTVCCVASYILGPEFVVGWVSALCVKDKMLQQGPGQYDTWPIVDVSIITVLLIIVFDVQL